MNSINMILCLFCATLITMSAFVNGQTTTPIDDNEMGMGILFDMVNIFLGDVIHKEKITDSFLNLTALFENGTFHGDTVDWKKLGNYLIGFAVCVAIGIVFIVVMPIVGLIFCCCRLCGNCGARPAKSANKRAKCKRRSYCTVLIILTTIALAGVVCAFICNSLLYKHMQNDNGDGTIGNINQSFHGIETYLNTSITGYLDYVRNKYNQQSSSILTLINGSAVNAVEIVLERKHVGELLVKAAMISRDANETKQNLDVASALLSELSSSSMQLKDNLTDIKNDVDSYCSLPNKSTQCTQFNSSKLNIDADFSSLNDLSNETANVGKALDMQKYIDQANVSLNEAKETAQKQLESKVNDAASALKDVEKQVDKGVNDLQSTKNKLFADFPYLYNTLNDGNDAVRKYSNYVYYVCIGVCCAFLLIIVLYYIGLLYGICGEKPGHGAPSCNTGCGAVFLMVGVAFTFIFSILMISCVVLFIVGGPLYTEVCRYFEGHDPSQFKELDEALRNLIKTNSYYNQTPGPSISGVIRNCQENKTLFGALELNKIINLNNTLNISQLNIRLGDFVNAKIIVNDINISGNLSKSLDNLANSGLQTVNYTKYFTELNKQLTVGDLGSMAIAIRRIAQQEVNTTLRQSLNDCATRLDILNNDTLPEMRNKTAKLNTTLISLQEKSALMDDVSTLKTNLSSTETSFNNNKDQLIKDEISKLTNGILQNTTDNINSIINDVMNKLYGCQNLSDALYTISDAVCIQAVEPVNGLWFSFGWCLIFFVPCLIFAVLLTGQYRRTLEDDKEFDEQSYMIYGNPNPDTIPLTSVDRVSGSSAHPRSGMLNAGYRDESKRAPYGEPPPSYNAYSGTLNVTPMDQHHLKGKAYPASHGDGFTAGNGANSSYSYPY